MGLEIQIFYKHHVSLPKAHKITSVMPSYFPPSKPSAKLIRDPKDTKFNTFTSLLPKKVPFEGVLGKILQLKMEDWDLADHTKFPHLVTYKYMKRVYYKEIGVTMSEMEEWVCGVEKSWLLTAPPLTQFVYANYLHWCTMGAYG